MTSAVKHRRTQANLFANTPKTCKSLIGKLPQDLLSHVLSYLSLTRVPGTPAKDKKVGEFSILTEVSKFWRQIASNPKVKALAVKNQVEPSRFSVWYDLHNYFKWMGHCLQSSKILHVSFNDRKMTKTTFGQSKRFLAGLPNLTSIEIDRLNGPEAGKFLQHVAKTCLELTWVKMRLADIDWKTIRATLFSMPKLEGVTFTQFGSQGVEVFLTIPSIRCMQIAVREMPATMPETVNQSVLKLQIERDPDMPAGQENRMVPLFRRCPNLRVLEMNIPTVPASFTYIVKNFPYLQHLILHQCQVNANIDGLILELATKHPQLQTLILPNMVLRPTTILGVLGALPDLLGGGCPALKNFTFNFSKTIWKDYEFQKLVEWENSHTPMILPKLQTLSTKSSCPRTFQLVADNYPNIQKLDIYFFNDSLPEKEVEYLLSRNKQIKLEFFSHFGVTPAELVRIDIKRNKLAEKFPGQIILPSS